MNGPDADLAACREGCGNATTQAIYKRFDAELQRFGARGRQVCRQDVDHHFETLMAALSSNIAEVFVQYALWLKDVLSSRGVPTTHLVFSFEAMSNYLQAQLAEPTASRVRAILTLAQTAITSHALPALFEPNRVPALEQTDRFQALILQGHNKPAMAVMQAAMTDGLTLTQAAVRLVQPALYRVGHLWQKSRISVSQEHLATAVSQNILAGAYLQASFAPPVGKSAMFACVEGGFHGVGLQILADAFDTAGWEVFNLGTNLPQRDLLRQIDAHRPNMLGLSISLPGQLAVARETIEMMRAEMGSSCPEIWVGGLATMGVPQVTRLTKADAWAADALHALEQR